MNYDLAKRLKDAGFPESGSWSEIETEGGTKLFIEGTIPAVPSLSELIAACGDDFEKLSHLRGAVKWKAWAYSTLFIGEGSTPEEAVARLWLALNK